MSSKRPKFCVITTPRSGSTWLATLLDSHPQIKSFEEPFIWRADRPNWTDKDFPTYYDYKTSKPKSPLTLFKYLDILDSYKSDTEFDIIGFKVMYNQIQENPEIMLKLLLDNYRIIHLIRQNYLDVIISRAAKKQHSIAHSNQVQSKARKVTLDTNYLLKDLNRCQRNNKLFRGLLKIMPLSVLEITYESMQKDYDRVLRSVADFLGVSSESITFKSDLKRINRGKYSEKIANYDEVVQTLSGSSYSAFLTS